MRWCETSTPSSVKRDCLGVAETIAWGLLLFLFLFFTSLSSPFIFIIILNGGSRFLLFIFITLSGSEFVWGCFFAFIRTLHSLWSIVSTFRSRLVAIRTWHICQPTWQEVSNPSYLSFSRCRLKTTCFLFRVYSMFVISRERRLPPRSRCKSQPFPPSVSFLTPFFFHLRFLRVFYQVFCSPTPLSFMFHQKIPPSLVNVLSAMLVFWRLLFFAGLRRKVKLKL